MKEQTDFDIPNHFLSHPDSIYYLRAQNGVLPAQLRALGSHVIEDPQFQTAPASDTKHHVYEGGLVVHTAEVLRFALGAADAIAANRVVVAMAAIWHDYAKIAEYRLVPSFGGKAEFYEHTSYRKLIRHVAGSFADFTRLAILQGLGPPIVESIGHCILAHHGRKEWGSPVEPQTPEAWILHAADMWSCHYGPGKDKKPE